MTSLVRLWGRCRPQLGWLAVGYACMVAQNLATVAYAALLGPALQLVFTGDVQGLLRGPGGALRPGWDLLPSSWVEAIQGLPPSQAVWFLPALIVALAAAKGLSQTGQFFLFGRASQRMLRTLRQITFEAVLRQSPRFFAQRPAGDVLSRLGGDVLEVERGMFYGLGSALRDSLGVAGLLGYVFYADWKLASVTLVTVPVAVVPLVRFTRWLRRVSARGLSAQGEIQAVLHQSLSGAAVVQAFGNEALEGRRLGAAAGRYYREMLASYFIRAVRTPTMEVLGAVVLGALFYLLGRKVHAEGGDPAHYVSMLGALFLMYDPLKKLGRVSDYLTAAAAAADRLLELLDLQPDVRDRPGAVPMPPFGAGPEPGICYESVTFAYEPGAPPALRAVDLEVAPGQCVALVGSSGAGKTTLVHLLPRFYDLGPGGGRITLDGRDVRDLTLASLRSQIAIVGQDTFLFQASIRDNIAYGRPDATEAEIRRAAEAAHAAGFIETLPAGYDTECGERGVMLSGGQRQRIAIARALLRDAPILILDEATSHLDIESERAVGDALRALMRGRTTLVIAHRLDTVRRADRIFVLEKGRVVEAGAHRDLIAAGGTYARVHDMHMARAPEAGSVG